MEIPGRAEPVHLPDELITEILSRLPVKSLLRFSCVSKSCNSLISNPSFVNLHLQRSPKNANLLLNIRLRPNDVAYVMSCSKHSLLQNPSSTIDVVDDGLIPLKENYYVVGSCNGLLCLGGYSFCGAESDSVKYWVRFWNPGMRLKSKKSPHFYAEYVNFIKFRIWSTKFGFGYDKSSDTYKAVAVLNNRQVKVYTMGGDRCWRDIQPFPVFPIEYRNHGRFVSGTLNWLALRNSLPGGTVSIDHQFIIISLDIGCETYKQLSLPDGLEEIPKFPHLTPILAILMDCLCLSYDYKATHFVVWQMKQFGIEKSWTRFVNVSYEHLYKMSLGRLICFPVLPWFILEEGDVLMLMDYQHYKIMLYSRRYNKVKYTENLNNKILMDTNDYVQSLVLPC